ncbi:MAG: hypothetical protein AAGF90_13925 [Pseudomonadota bacterium]
MNAIPAAAQARPSDDARKAGDPAESGDFTGAARFYGQQPVLTSERGRLARRRAERQAAEREKSAAGGDPDAFVFSAPPQRAADPAAKRRRPAAAQPTTEQWMADGATLSFGSDGVSVVYEIASPNPAT